MRAVVLEDFGRLSLQELPSPAEGEVLLKVAACGVCGSDLSVYKGTPAMRARWRPPLVLGHEIAAVVQEGPPDWVGQAVAVNPLVACGRCNSCRRGLSNLCSERTNVGFHHPGGFAQQIRLPLAQLYPLPEGLPIWKGALCEPLAVALRAVELAGATLGRRVLVLGGGAIGTLAAWLLQRGGARVWVAEHNPLRRAWLEGLGFVQGVLEAPEGSFEVVLDCVGGAQTVEAAVNAVEPGGLVVLVGLEATAASLPLQRLVLQEIGLKGAYVFTHDDFSRAVGLVAQLPDELAVVRPFGVYQETFQELLEGRLPQAKAVLVWEG
ncbi:MAG: alcohol dehydrogenase catalytic domain-containing protein [Meiothermus sp.]|uniref:alcohol dehydrogenase catalytic domain-containing protein n=1 Tax=Meiothermus sp. TaxID=1955249 RepID=UPI0025DC35AA|nr:alcohol dehydrogenase catalytic domain-containing protein [Meiothermus sp.]MCS7057586.1 alcohol dehydrogenase catalytic domain-containing protein [Meiothermus sp.]MCS7195193.1 alcohol dehydrogenase catalytic domain-containing protein [Meiothermus sp.]MCX7740230.1 alcohol dehydrogenase catalytic domain-containing protein [Meiothermus sp.]MDW8091681.1 alcohol dehydrogenase catalytic domain-containing protein [Meiothermus sp.]MDW8481291.1 alcohol dehydrogenase catalytic domain-containing prote